MKMLYTKFIKVLLVLTLFCLCQNVAAQTPNYYYYFNIRLQSVPKEVASILGKGYKMENSVLVDYYRMEDNKLILSIEYTDSTLRRDNGIFQSYFENGLFENNGTYINGKQNGLWMIYDSLGRTVDSTIYAMGKIMNYKKQYYFNSGSVESVENYDSISGALSLIKYDSVGALWQTFIYSSPEKGIATYYENGISRTEPLTTQARKEAEYVGGLNGWRRFLEQKIDPMYLFDKKAPAGTYTAIISFTVNEDGIATDFVPETNLGYGLEEELISKMQNGMKWQPATMFGRKVKAHRRQPITIVVPKD